MLGRIHVFCGRLSAAQHHQCPTAGVQMLAACWRLARGAAASGLQNGLNSAQHWWWAAANSGGRLFGERARLKRQRGRAAAVAAGRASLDWPPPNPRGFQVLPGGGQHITAHHGASRRVPDCLGMVPSDLCQRGCRSMLHNERPHDRLPGRIESLPLLLLCRSRRERVLVFPLLFSTARPRPSSRACSLPPAGSCFLSFACSSP